ncbi:unnamed protein product [Staurois parvus]|uniref:Uncharacterized protein n=1 Tax=Staurois parvus TaxID=386267 RepID=A0ABN9G0P1_9NEOB|nr:unnamed protein product [Staurois parvus]
MQMSAVDLRITAHFTHLGSQTGPKPECGPQCGGGGSSQWEANTAPYDKNGNHQQCEET